LNAMYFQPRLRICTLAWGLLGEVAYSILFHY